MIYLMNSAVMPAGNYGVYTYRASPVPETLCKSAIEELRAILRGDLGEWESRIGYPQNISLIREWTGVTIPLSRDATQFADGDRAFVMRLPTRVANPATKGAAVSSDPSDWEFAWVEYGSTILPPPT